MTFDPRAVKATVAQMEPRFRTRDLSKHPDMLRAHGLWIEDRNYHGMVGRYLSENRELLNLRQVSSAEKSNAEWRKVGKTAGIPLAKSE